MILNNSTPRFVEKIDTIDDLKAYVDNRCNAITMQLNLVTMAIVKAEIPIPIFEDAKDDDG